MRELFNQVDIDANRQGRLSPEQEKFIKASVDPKTWIWGAGITMALGILGGGCLVSIGAEGVFGILGPILGVAFLFCAYRWFTMWSAAVDRHGAGPTADHAKGHAATLMAGMAKHIFGYEWTPPVPTDTEAVNGSN